MSGVELLLILLILGFEMALLLLLVGFPYGLEGVLYAGSCFERKCRFCFTSLAVGRYTTGICPGGVQLYPKRVRHATLLTSDSLSTPRRT